MRYTFFFKTHFCLKKPFLIPRKCILGKIDWCKFLSEIQSNLKCLWRLPLYFLSHLGNTNIAQFAQITNIHSCCPRAIETTYIPYTTIHIRSEVTHKHPLWLQHGSAPFVGCCLSQVVEWQYIETTCGLLHIYTHFVFIAIRIYSFHQIPIRAKCEMGIYISQARRFLSNSIAFPNLTPFPRKSNTRIGSISNPVIPFKKQHSPSCSDFYTSQRPYPLYIQRGVAY